MQPVRLLSFLALCSIIHASVAKDDEPPESGCWTKKYFGSGQVFLRCTKLGGIDGQSFEQAIREESIPYEDFAPGRFDNGTYVPPERFFRNVSLSDIVHSVNFILLQNSPNITLSENAFARFENLSQLNIWGPSVDQGERGRLNLAPGVFRQAPRLDQIEISRMDISDESIPALLELKDRLITVAITDVTPEDKVFTSLAQFTKLGYMGFFNCSSRPFPTSVIRGSVGVLETFEIQNCTFPKLAKNLFANSPKLNRIFLKNANLSEVETGALDQNPELWVVSLSDNNLPSLHDELFSKLNKLWSVVLEGNPRLKGSIERSNFTHVQDFENFRFRLS